jgi:uncharacterized membrane protein
MHYHQSTNTRERSKNNVENNYNMAHFVAVVSYFTLAGWLLALIIYGHHKSSLSSFHLRQSLGLIITGCLLSFIPLIGWVLNLGVIAAWFYGLYFALKGVERAVPLLGDLYQQHLDFIC